MDATKTASIAARTWMESEGIKLEALRQHVPLAPHFDHLLRCEANLERSFDRMLIQFERLQRMSLRQPVLPILEVQHSLSWVVNGKEGNANGLSPSLFLQLLGWGMPFDPGNPKLQNELGQVLLRKVEKSRVGVRALDASEAKCRVARSRVPWPDAVSRGAIVPTTRPASPDGRKEASGSALDSRSTTAGGGGESRGPGHAGSKTDTSE